MCKNAHNHYSCDTSKPAGTHIPIYRRMDKQTVCIYRMENYTIKRSELLMSEFQKTC